MDALELVLVLTAGLLAGMANTIVGAGTLVTFPLLIALGYQPLTANVSNTVGLVPASVTGAWGYRRELVGHWRTVLRMAVLSAVGGIAGGLLLLVAPAEAFTAVVPWLLVLAAVLAAIQPRVAAAVRRRAESASRGSTPAQSPTAARGRARSAEERVAPAADAVASETPDARAPTGVGSGAVTHPLTVGLALGITATGVYGGYFGAAQGVVLLGLLGIAWTTDLQRANGAKNVLAGVANLVSATVFVVGGVVDWRLAGLIAVGSALGGVIGARVGRRIPARVLRVLIVVVALSAAVLIALDR